MRSIFDAKRYAVPLAGFLVFSVNGNGPRIAPQFHSMLFEPLKRLHGHERPGCGIGLAFRRKFIEPDGGKIRVESHEPNGAALRFTVPAFGKVSSATQ